MSSSISSSLSPAPSAICKPCPDCTACSEINHRPSHDSGDTAKLSESQQVSQTPQSGYSEFRKSRLALSVPVATANNQFGNYCEHRVVPVIATDGSIQRRSGEIRLAFSFARYV